MPPSSKMLATKAKTHPLLALLGFLGALYPLAYVETLFHEAGHALAGLAYACAALDESR